MNQELEKTYQLSELQNFVQEDSIDVIEIIGHDIGTFDDPYFILLNTLVNKDAKIKYWLYDKNKEREKIKKLQALFPNHKVEIVYYPD